MARKLKTYQTSLGFFDQAIAAPSMKAALEAWGADSNLFHQGAAMESDDPDVVAATMAKPGVVLKRPVGSTGPFREHAELPAKLGVGGKPKKAPRKPDGRKPKKDAARPVDEVAEHKAAFAYERERKSRERGQAKEQAARQKERERRQQAIRRRPHWTGRKRSTPTGRRPSEPRPRRLRSGRRPRTPAGIRKGSG
jgi:hypothetical protein